MIDDLPDLDELDFESWEAFWAAVDEAIADYIEHVIEGDY